MKKILVFESEEGDGDQEFKIASSGQKYWSAIWDTLQFIRGKLKYEDLPDDQYKLLEEVRAKLVEDLDGMEEF